MRWPRQAADPAVAAFWCSCQLHWPYRWVGGQPVRSGADARNLRTRDQFRDSFDVEVVRAFGRCSGFNRLATVSPNRTLIGTSVDPPPSTRNREDVFISTRLTALRPGFDPGGTRSGRDWPAPLLSCAPISSTRGITNSFGPAPVPRFPRRRMLLVAPLAPGPPSEPGPPPPGLR